MCWTKLYPIMTSRVPTTQCPPWRFLPSPAAWRVPLLYKIKQNWFSLFFFKNKQIFLPGHASTTSYIVGIETWVTTETLQYEVEFSSRLEGVEQVHDERVSHRLQNLTLCSSVSRVLGITHYFCLQTNKKVQKQKYNRKKSGTIKNVKLL